MTRAQHTAPDHNYQPSALLGRAFCSGSSLCTLGNHPEAWSADERAYYLRDGYRGYLIVDDSPAMRVRSIREAIGLLTDRGFAGRDGLYYALLIQHFGANPIVAFAVGEDGRWHHVNA